MDEEDKSIIVIWTIQYGPYYLEHIILRILYIIYHMVIWYIVWILPYDYYTEYFLEAPLNSNSPSSVTITVMQRGPVAMLRLALSKCI